MPNLVQSIKDKLLNVARQQQLHNTTVQINYFKECLLYRLSLSPYKNQLFLKGGTFIYAIDNQMVRPTLDLDMLAREMLNTEDAIKQVFEEIMSIDKSDEDAVEFDTNSITTEVINAQSIQTGVRIRCKAKFKGTNSSQFLKIEIGFGDSITPNPQQLEYRTLLPRPNLILLQAYTLETVIAEKFHAMVVLGETNGRMKDFYDVFKFLEQQSYSNKVLQQAIVDTFRARQTIYTSDIILFTEQFIQNDALLIRWDNFLISINLANFNSFSTVVQRIVDVLQPMYEQLKPN
ncbi:MAG: nucleotidyl transferase AbiEii/AbiGii toxin family protein [Sphingobacteriales bacterium]|nr:nucleotidyl transferase AbiEii/AbiGii toxin family protein [Sphingobacteriales bacterium]